MSKQLMNIGEKIKIKIVPDANPNGKAKWIEIPYEGKLPIGWIATNDVLKHYVPNGYHMVAVRRENYHTT